MPIHLPSPAPTPFVSAVETDPNLYLFQLFVEDPLNGQAMLNSWVSLMAVLLAVIMNEGLVDSLQNGLASSISSQWLKNSPLVYARWVVG